jgi:hypothetical protein
MAEDRPMTTYQAKVVRLYESELTAIDEMLDEVEVPRYLDNPDVALLASARVKYALDKWLDCQERMEHIRRHHEHKHPQEGCPICDAGV